ncbi:MAG: sugar phosphate isomerase/epimerase family protein [Chitinophagales bacterium]
MRFSLYSLVLEDKPLEEAVRLAAHLGFEGIELLGRAPHLPADTPRARVKELAVRLSDLGLAAVNLATYTGGYSQLDATGCQAQLDELKRFLEMAYVLGCPMVRHAPGGPSPREAEPRHWERAAEWLKKACTEAAGAGVTLVSEIHFGGLEESAESCRRLLDLVQRPNYGMVHDAGNMYIAGADYGPDSLRVLGEGLRHVHVKDEAALAPGQADEGSFQVSGRSYRHRLLGEGAVDHRPLLQALAAQGYQGFLSVEYHGPGERLAAARHDLTCLRKLVSELE